MFRNILIYLAKFIGIFCVLYYGSLAVIGLSSPGNHYNTFVANYLNFIDPFRHFLLASSKATVSALGYKTVFIDPFTIAIPGGRGVRMVYSCIGFGVLSFWIAFVAANSGSFKRKLLWIVSGCAALIAINILRISLLLIAINKGWAIPFGWDHHTWFNIAAYLLIFTMMYVYDRNNKAKRLVEHGVQPQASPSTKTPAQVGESRAETLQ